MLSRNNLTTALELFDQFHQVECDIQALTDSVAQMEQPRSRAAPIAQMLHAWLIAQRAKLPSGTTTANALDYSLSRWAALTRNLHDPRQPIDNNHDEHQIRPWAMAERMGCSPARSRPVSAQLPSRA